MIEFINGEEMAREHPETFEIPTLEERSSVKPGQFIKVGANGERFWLRVASVMEDGSYCGIVDNDLVRSDEHGLYLGDDVIVGKEHVLDILT